jgi:hypothetical protein
MFPPRHTQNFCTLRKPRQATPPIQPDLPELPERSRESSQDAYGRPFVESAEEIVAQYREKQKAGFMYGTLHRQPRILQTKPGGGPEASGGFQPFLGQEHEQHTCGGSVVPPPPMFEEGVMSQKTPLIGKKGKDKKDKMESRV